MALFGLRAAYTYYFSNSKHGRILASCLVLSAVPFLPSANVFFDVGFVLAERNLYLPSLGHALLVSLGFGRLSSHFAPKSRKKKLLRSLATLLLMVFAAKSLLRSGVWQTERSLFSSGLLVCPGNAKVWNLCQLYLSPVQHLIFRFFRFTTT